MLKEKQSAARAKREAQEIRAMPVLRLPEKPKLPTEMEASFVKIEQRIINKARLLLTDDPELGPQLAAAVLRNAAKLAEDLATSLSK